MMTKMIQFAAYNINKTKAESGPNNHKQMTINNYRNPATFKYSIIHIIHKDTGYKNAYIESLCALE